MQMLMEKLKLLLAIGILVMDCNMRRTQQYDTTLNCVLSVKAYYRLPDKTFYSYTTMRSSYYVIVTIL